MDHRYIDFVTSHYALVGLMVALFVAFVITELQRSGKSVSPQSLTALVNSHNALVIDVRDPAEFKQGHITGSENVPYSRIGERAAELKKDLDRPIVIVCKMGQVAGSAVQQLKAAGLTQVYKLDGGISGWKSASLPLVKK